LRSVSKQLDFYNILLNFSTLRCVSAMKSSWCDYRDKSIPTK